MGESGEDKLIAVARHIAKTLGRTETMTDDILQIFSSFDGRFSRDKLSDSLSKIDSLDAALHSLDRRISAILSSPQPLWAPSPSPSPSAVAFLDALDDLISTIHHWDPLAHSDKTVATSLSLADDLLHRAMLRLQVEFRSLVNLTSSSLSPAPGSGSIDNDSDGDSDDEDKERIPIAQPLADYDVVIDAMPSAYISDLHQMAKRMVAGGFGKECSHAFSLHRREFTDESLCRLGLKKRSIAEVQKMAWEDLEEEIERWTRGVTLALKILFPSERRLCDRVFAGLPASASDHAFMEVTRGAAIQLLNFADAFAIGTRSPERLFRVLDLYETMRDLMPDFDAVFADPFCAFLRTEAATILKRLGESIRGIFMELENLIRRDPTKAAVPGGGLHPITRYVMNYLRAACGSRLTLEQVLEDSSKSSSAATLLHGRTTTPASSLSIELDWIMELLESNLEAKAKIYRDPALMAVFLMNNNRYIVKKVRDGELGSLLGDDWIRKHLAKMRQQHTNYQRSTWSKVLAVLKIDGPPSLKSLKEKVKLFNLYFEEICQAQSTWVVADEQLREELRISAGEALLPAYRNFLGRFQTVPEAGKHWDKYIKYSLEEVESKISGLYQGQLLSMASRKS